MTVLCPAMIDTKKIRRLRSKLKLTQQQAAEKAGFKSRQWWNDVETGRAVNLSVETLGRIATALGVRTKDLLL